jgi:hypothetical protein
MSRAVGDWFGQFCFSALNWLFGQVDALGGTSLSISTCMMKTWLTERRRQLSLGGASMRRKWIALAAVTAGFSIVPLLSAAQGPQGVGAGEAARAAAPSHNPINWLKKKPLTPSETLDANSNQSAKLNSRLQKQGLLPVNANLNDTCETFRDLGDCVATLHAGHNLVLDFNCLKSKVTGVQVGGDPSSCTNATDGKPMSLSKAIHALEPGVDAQAEANKAAKQSKDDLTEGLL